MTEREKNEICKGYADLIIFIPLSAEIYSPPHPRYGGDDDERNHSVNETTSDGSFPLACA